MEGVPALSNWDVVAIVAYFGLVLAIGIASMFRKNRETVSGYFLAGRFMTWLTVGASLFASNIGSEHFIGLAGSGAASGIGVASFELNALFILQLLGWVFLPVYIASGVHTLPEYMHKRFGGSRIRLYLAILSLVLYIFTKISVNMYSGALFVQEALGWNIYGAVVLVLAMTAICTMTGGLAAVMYTDTMQCLLMVVGASGLAIFAFARVGGYAGLMAAFPLAIANSTLLSNSSCGIPSDKSFTLLRAPDDPDFPWPGFFLGQSPASIWYWATDQMMVQRVLAAKSLSHAQGATIFAGYLKLLPLFIIVMPGMISRVLYPDEIGCATDCESRCGNHISCTNVAYPKLVLRLMPPGARGVMLAVMLAALMSDLTSIFNSSSTLFTIDIWHRFRPRATTKELLAVGRLFVLFMVVVSILWVPIVHRQQGGQLYIYIQAIAADLSPPIAAVFLLAILWPRCNETGAFWGLAVGFFVGIFRMILQFLFSAPPCGVEDTRPSILSAVHYMYFAMLLFWLTVFTTVTVSLFTPAPDPQRLIRTTFWTRKDTGKRMDDYEPGVEEIKETEGEEMERLNGTGSEAEDTDDAEEKPKRQRWRLASAFCPGSQKQTNAIDEAQFKTHLEATKSLYQSRTEQSILNLNLVIIISVGIFMYTYFSIPQSF